MSSPSVTTAGPSAPIPFAADALARVTATITFRNETDAPMLVSAIAAGNITVTQVTCDGAALVASESAVATPKDSAIRELAPGASLSFPLDGIRTLRDDISIDYPLAKPAVCSVRLRYEYGGADPRANLFRGPIHLPPFLLTVR